MKKYLPFLIIAGVAVTTVVATVALYYARRPPVLTIAEKERAKNDSSWMHALGRADSPVTLEEFGDFQCPPCGALASPIDRLAKAYPEKLRVIYREFPLPNHTWAFDAAKAAEAAGLQGKFWPMHDILFHEQANWSGSADARALFDSYARKLGLEMTRFEKDLTGDEVRKRVEMDKERGTSQGVTTTPTIFLNNHSIAPASLRPDLLKAAVEDELKAAHK